MGSASASFGVDVKKQLFGNRTDIVGHRIAINATPMYLIVGLMSDKQQNSPYSDLDERKSGCPYTVDERATTPLSQSTIPPNPE